MSEIRPDVRALIWRHYRDGDADENDILRRLLTDIEQKNAASLQASESTIGAVLIEGRAGVSFLEGFEISRVFKGKVIRAVATPTGWRETQSSRVFPSLNQLSLFITGRPENAWGAWSFVDDEGRSRKLNSLRQTETAQSGNHNISWRESVKRALNELGGTAHLREIYSKVKKIRESVGLSIPTNFEAIVRKELEINSPDSKHFQGGKPLFYSKYGIGEGVWTTTQGETQETPDHEGD